MRNRGWNRGQVTGRGFKHSSCERQQSRVVVLRHQRLPHPRGALEAAVRIRQPSRLLLFGLPLRISARVGVCKAGYRIQDC